MAVTLDQPHLDPVAGAPIVNSASITPPQSANGKKDVPEGVPSELSDLELDPKAAPASDEPAVKQEEEQVKEEPTEEEKMEEEKMEEEEEIEPDHYYGGGKVPVFKPVSASLSPAGLAASTRKHADRDLALDNGPIPRLPVVHQQD